MVALILTTSIFSIANVPAQAATKAEVSRTIAIVFDNSGSMYDDGDKKAWCRATYAMEVFASMLNKGDTLMIYPMHPITVNGAEYTMESPFVIKESSQASSIRDIYTEKPYGTPIESIDSAIEGLKKVNAQKKYLIVLTDGGTFSKDNRDMNKANTVSELDSRIQSAAGKDMSVMYLGIGNDASMPNTAESEYFVKKKAVDSADVLSTLTDMCNQIFGRDTLPEKRISGKNVNFDITMSKLIVFVQGENISGLKLSGGKAGNLVSTQQTKYSTTGCGLYSAVPDDSLQGMMVTYTDVDAGDYTIEFSGSATSIEVYYEPNADLEFVFTDGDGNKVDPNALYEGDYKVGFGMQDGKTGDLIESDLLGNPKYRGMYSVNGTEYDITHEGYKGERSVPLKMNDTFDARLTVTYLSGYTISKDSTDFGWPAGGINVTARPAGDFWITITGGDAEYDLQDLEKGSTYTARVFYKGQMLTGEQLKSVELYWLPETSNVEIKKELAEDHYKLSLHYKDPANPQNTVIGECSVEITATYEEQGSDPAEASAQLSYNITDNSLPLKVEMVIADDYIVISDMAETRPIVVTLKFGDRLLTEEEFASTELVVDCGGMQYEITPVPGESEYEVKLLSAEDFSEGDYPVKVTAKYTDRIGRTTQTEDEGSVTLSNTPIWVKWVAWLLLILLIIIIILVILHIKVLPKHAHITKKGSTMMFDGEDETKSTSFDAKIEKSGMTIYSKYAGVKSGILMDVKPGKESYLRKSQVRRSAEVKSASVKKYGNATMLEATIGSIKYVLNEDTGKLERVPKSDKPFVLKHGTNISYSGTMNSNGTQKPFTVSTKLNFKKK